MHPILVYIDIDNKSVHGRVVQQLLCSILLNFRYSPNASRTECPNFSAFPSDGRETMTLREENKFYMMVSYIIL